jgi:hypothetical protein
MIFVGTSAWLALADSNDHDHGRALGVHRQILRGEFGKQVTTNYVMAETVTIIPRRLGLGPALSLQGGALGKRGRPVLDRAFAASRGHRFVGEPLGQAMECGGRHQLRDHAGPRSPGRVLLRPGFRPSGLRGAPDAGTVTGPLDRTGRADGWPAASPKGNAAPNTAMVRRSRDGSASRYFIVVARFLCRRKPWTAR